MKFLILFIFFMAIAQAQDFIFDKEKGRAVPTYVAQIKLMKGQIYRKVGTSREEVKLGERFKEGEAVITEEKSFVKLLMVDDSIISIGPSSEIIISKFDFKDKSDRSLIIELVKGQITGDIKNRAKKGDLTFKTRYTTMGVRGTYFLMNQQTLGNREVSQYAVLEGQIELQNNLSLSEGEKIDLIFDDARPTVQNQRKLTAQEIASLNPQIDEDKDIKPFLPFLSSEELSGLTQQDGDSGQNSSFSAQSEEKRADLKPHWKDNLKKLNEKLKQKNNTR
jgi:hypothetical protein